jgi:RNA polymerase sigma-70 factor (ECF subfamily)
LQKAPEVNLLRRAQKSDPGALAEIYDSYFERIYRFVYARVGNHPDTEDITGQVFLKMLDGLPAYRLRGVPFSTWLYRVARNLLIDRHRRARPPTAELHPQVADPEPRTDPAVVLQTSEDRRRLFRALQQLTDDQRQVIVLRFIDNLDVRRVARIMKRRPGAIHSTQHRALATLNRIMRERPELEASRG